MHKKTGRFDRVFGISLRCSKGLVLMGGFLQRGLFNGDRRQNHHPSDDPLVIRHDVQQIHAVVDEPEDDSSRQGPGYGSDAARHARSPDDDRRDDIQLPGIACQGLA